MFHKVGVGCVGYCECVVQSCSGGNSMSAVVIIEVHPEFSKECFEEGRMEGVGVMS